MTACRAEYRAKRLKEMQENPRDPHHGTKTGYFYGCRCDRCRKAHADYLRDWRARKAKAKDESAYLKHLRHAAREQTVRIHGVGDVRI